MKTKKTTRVSKFRKGSVCRSFDQWGRLTRFKFTVLSRSEGFYYPLDRRDVLPRVHVQLGQSTFFASVRVKQGVEYVDIRNVGVRVVARV